MDRVEFYQQENRRWHWKVKAKNGYPLARSAVSYHDERAARLAFSNLLRLLEPMVAALPGDG